MMYEIKTPLLKQISSELMGVISATKGGTMKPEEGHMTIRACNGVRGAVETDLKVRLSAPKLAEIEGAPATA